MKKLLLLITCLFLIVSGYSQLQVQSDTLVVPVGADQLPHINFTRDKVKRLPSAISTYSIFISWISIMNALLVSGALYMCSKEYDWSKEFTFYVISLASFLAIFVSWGLFKLWRFLLTSKKYLE